MASPSNTVYHIQGLPAPGLYHQHIPEYTEKDFADISVVPNPPKIIFIGDAAVGKTTLVTAMKTSRFEETYHATIGVAFVSIQVRINSADFKVALWDTAGSEEQNSLTTTFYRGSDVACLCFSLVDKRSFQNVATWYNRLAENTTEMPTVFLVGCKSDLEPTVEKQDIEEFCRNYSAEYFELSSKKLYHIREFVERISLVSVIVREKGNRVAPQTISLSPEVGEPMTRPARRSGCCA